MKSTLLCLLFAASSLASRAEFAPLDGIENHYLAVSAPTAAHNDATKRIVAQLAKSQVSTDEQAAKLALKAFVKKPGLDAREMWGVSGLYRLGRDVPDFGAAGDMIWEVRVSRSGNGVSGLVWVSASTGATRVLFP